MYGYQSNTVAQVGSSGSNLECGGRIGAAMAAFSEPVDWLADNAARDVGWQMVHVGDKAHNLTLNPATSSFAVALESTSLWSISTLDYAVHRFLKDFVELDMRKPSTITAGLPLVSSPTPVVLAIFAYIVVVWLWSSYIRRVGLKPRSQDPGWLRALVVVHNWFLCCLSFYMGCGIISEARHHGYSFFGNSGNDGEVKMGFYIYIFYVSKLYEFMDTVSSCATYASRIGSFSSVAIAIHYSNAG